ncbi:MAG: hypothetical protein JST32_10935, partial [Bacteroidetes bacterium]|nr:hypothetical protein [Bacteroidota bacterium]
MDSKLEKSLLSRTAELEKELAEKTSQLEIEAALERVRTVAMGMRTPNDLLSICKVLFEELTALGFSELRNAMINIANDEKGSFHNYDFNGQNSTITQFSHNSHLVIERQVAITRSATDAFIEHVLTGADLQDFKAFRVRNGEAPDPRLENISALYYYFYAISDGSVGISAFSPLSEEKRDVLKRFRNVFDLAYRRYVDIEQAEARAGEAQIELSLEKVRASAMAMHKTDQLLGAAELLYKELTGLGINSMAITYAIMAADEKSAAYYSINPVDGKLNPVPFDLSHTETEVMRVILSGWKKQEAFSKLILDEEATLKHQTYIAGVVQAHFAKNNFDHPFSVEAFLEVSPKNAVIYAFNFTQGYIFIIGSEHLTRSQEEMVIRFAKVFEMTYRRFLDLKQAEAQAREAQIEAALERVRSKSLAMYHTSEIQLVIHTVHEELLKLNISIFGGSFIVINKDIADKLYVWGSGGTADTATEILVPDFNMTFCTNLINRIKQGWGFFTEEFSREEKIEYFTELFRHEPWCAIPLEEQKAVLESEGNYTRSVTVSNYTSIFIVNHNGRKFTDDENDILKRFSRVFEQSYTRFLDLQKAEEQAREAQIEAALERVRSRSMGMQKSDELKDVIQIVFDQLVHLNIGIDHTGFVVDYEPGGDWHFWVADEIGSPNKITVANFDSVWGNDFDNARKKKIDFFTTYLDLEAKNKFYRDMFERIPGMPQEYCDNIFSKAGLAASTVLMENVALYIENFSLIPYTDEENAILMRFGKVFQQTYTRFLDLQKAEEQAREARIE